jgi:sec-independent protein translocase protein TatA
MHILILLFLSNLFSSDMLIIAFVALLLFGGEKLPEIARTVGKGIRDFKDASDGVKREINNQINSFEEKKTEEKLNQAAQNQISANGTELTENHQPVQNTMPFNENYGSTGEDNSTNVDTAVHAEHPTEDHTVVSHTDNEATNNELIKNS